MASAKTDQCTNKLLDLALEPLRALYPQTHILPLGTSNQLAHPPMILKSVSAHFCKQHGNLYMTAKSIFENCNLFENAFLI